MEDKIYYPKPEGLLHRIEDFSIGKTLVNHVENKGFISNNDSKYITALIEERDIIFETKYEIEELEGFVVGLNPAQITPFSKRINKIIYWQKKAILKNLQE